MDKHKTPYLVLQFTTLHTRLKMLTIWLVITSILATYLIESQILLINYCFQFADH